MTRLMGKNDWIQTVADVGTAESVWYENVLAEGGCVPLSMPERGAYRVILVKIGGELPIEKQQRKSARDYIGCCKGNYNGRCTTAEIMKEIREGEE